MSVLFATQFASDAVGGFPGEFSNYEGGSSIVQAFGPEVDKSAQVLSGGMSFGITQGFTGVVEFSLYAVYYCNPSVGFNRSVILFFSSNHNNTLNTLLCYFAIESDGSLSLFAGDNSFLGNSAYSDGIISLNDWNQVRIDLVLFPSGFDPSYVGFSTASIFLNNIQVVFGGGVSGIPVPGLPGGLLINYIVFEGPTNDGFITNIALCSLHDDNPFAASIRTAFASQAVVEWSSVQQPNAVVSQGVIEATTVQLPKARISQAVIELFGTPLPGGGSVYEA